jgi:protein-arginine kinase activator protein McsA
MSFQCERCGYSTEFLGNLRNHFKRKNLCPAVLADISLHELKAKYTKKSTTCEQCGKEFASPQSKYNHKKYHCKNTVSQLQQTINNLQEELEVHKKTAPHNVTHIQNQNIQQNILINIKNFGQENMEYLSKDFLNSCLITNNIVPLIESIHFDKEHPENHNVKMKSIRYDLMEQYVDGKWIVTDKEETLDELINKGYRVLKYHSRKNKHDLLASNELDEDEYDDVNEWLDNLYEDKKTRKPVKRQLLLLFINNKTMLLEREQ